MTQRSVARRILEAWRRALRGRLLFAAGSVLAFATVVLGFLGWTELRVQGISDRLYLTLLAFTGDPVYVANHGSCTFVPAGAAPGPDAPPPCADAFPLELTVARFTGFATTALALIGLVAYALADRLAKAWAGWRSGHAVLVGVTAFGLDRLRREAPGLPITAIGTAEIEPGAGVLHFPIDPDDTEALHRLVGSPAKILFGERASLRNIARAQALLPDLGAADVIVRVEDLSLVRDLGLLAMDLARAEPVSSSEAVAEAVVFALSAPELAELRGQPGVHVVMVGLGTTGLAVAEQLAATCQDIGPDGAAHHPRLTVLDVDAAATEARIDGQSPGLRAAAMLTIHGMDGEACQTRPCLERLRDIEAAHPITAIVVATGDDARNAAIGMRLRQVQRERLLLKAPILVRNRMANGRAPVAIDDISGGTYAFGGNRSGPQDPDLVMFEEELGEALHTGWVQANRMSPDATTPSDAPRPWEALTSAEKRSSLVAARSAPHLLRAGGLVPDPGTPEAGMRIHQDAVRRLSERKPVLGRLEHQRWIAERRLEGWTSDADRFGQARPRDDERRIHTALLEWEDLTEEQRRKAIDNVGFLIRTCEARWRRGGPAWRHRLRVGVMGPLDPGADAARSVEDGFAAYLRAWPSDVPLRATSLEVLTPDAPGFDRVAPVALLAAWRAVVGGGAGRSCRVVTFRAAGRRLLDEKASAHLARRSGGAEPSQERISQQAEAFAQACKAEDGRSIVRGADLRPPDVSDADLARDATLWDASLARVEARIDALSDLLVWGRRSDGTGRSAAIAAGRAERGRDSLPIDLD